MLGDGKALPHSDPKLWSSPGSNQGQRGTGTRYWNLSFQNTNTHVLLLLHTHIRAPPKNFEPNYEDHVLSLSETNKVVARRPLPAQ
jgi:hypothetical protein